MTANDSELFKVDLDNYNGSLDVLLDLACLLYTSDAADE